MIGMISTEGEEREWGTIILLFAGVILLVIGWGIGRGDLIFYKDSRPFLWLGGLCLVPIIIKGIIALVTAIPSVKN